MVKVHREHFEDTWNEACAVLQAVTDIQGDFSPLTKEEIDSLENDRQARNKNEMESISSQAICEREIAFEKAIELFKAGMYEVFLEQFGRNYTPMPDSMLKRIEIAKRKLKSKQ